jgi:hypothetical protein
MIDTFLHHMCPHDAGTCPDMLQLSPFSLCTTLDLVRPLCPRRIRPLLELPIRALAQPLGASLPCGHWDMQCGCLPCSFRSGMQVRGEILMQNDSSDWPSIVNPCALHMTHIPSHSQIGPRNSNTGECRPTQGPLPM